MLKKTYIDNGSGGGTQATVNRLIGNEVANIRGNPSYIETVSQILQVKVMVQDGETRPHITAGYPLESPLSVTPSVISPLSSMGSRPSKCGLVTGFAEIRDHMPSWTQLGIVVDNLHHWPVDNNIADQPTRGKVTLHSQYGRQIFPPTL